MPRRLAIVLSHPVQYYSPWFRWMTARTDLSLKVFYLWDAGVKSFLDPQFGRALSWDVDLLSGYDHEFVPNTAERPGSNHFGGLRNPSLPARIAAWRPDSILLFGYNYHSHLRVLVWARIHGVPVIFRGDSHLLGRQFLSWRKRVPLSLLYRQFAAFLCVGSANHDYFRAFGVPARRLFFTPHCVNADFFTADEAKLAEAARLRVQLGISPTTHVILFAGKFVAAKQPRELLAAFLALAPCNAALVFVGDGAERDELITLAASAPAATVHFLPFANQSEMPSRYLLADLFVLPSRGNYETWGLAVNEAMHLGVPALVSDRVGCQRDLVTDGETGWVFTTETTGALADKLSEALKTLSDTAAMTRMRVSIKKRISGYTYRQATEGLVSALSSLHDNPSSLSS